MGVSSAAEDLPELGHILTWGNGDLGQLGLGEDIRERKKPAIIKELSGKRIHKFATGGGVFVITKEEEEEEEDNTRTKVWSWGCNDDAILGRDGDEMLPGVVMGLEEDIIDISSGDYHTAAIGKSGKVYIWGVYKDSNGYLGFTKSQSEKQPVPTPVSELSDHTIIAIDSGANHTLALTSRGEVYQWGDVRQGRREVARLKKEVLKPTRVKFPRVKGGVHVTKIFAGAFHNFALTKEGEVYGWGFNNYGQLGTGDMENRLNPEPVAFFSKLGVVSIAAGQTHTTVLTGEGKVYSFGRGDYGQLGLGDDLSHQSKPVEIPPASFGLEEDDVVIGIAAGTNHSLAWTKKGKAFAWGFGTEYQLGNGEEQDENKPYRLTGQQLEGRRIIQLGAGAQYSVALVHDLPKQPNGDSSEERASSSS
eukprot:TRINITY_DN0_c0_g3_i1.p1 TRINITY_DN0_c0_g3~~TRINITY_DN0_c0_g3_i1.p1  ORF type:complete len:419 (+),score=98.20 TRINITY_DN0_c0_g3_i1:293-1549(+)